MSNLNCIAIDDEPLALDIIRAFCERHGGLSLTCYTNPMEGMEAVQASEPDILFLDIELGDVKGVDLARQRPRRTHLIFTTAYAEYALEGYELNAVDYLHKPFAYDRFAAAIEKVLRIAPRQDTPAADHGGEIAVKADYQTLHIRLADISYVEAMDNYVKIHREDGRTLLSQMSMKSLMELLPPKMFIRVHKSYIVPRNRITSHTHSSLTVKDCPTAIPIGRTYLPGVLDALQQPYSHE